MAFLFFCFVSFFFFLMLREVYLLTYLLTATGPASVVQTVKTVSTKLFFNSSVSFNVLDECHTTTDFISEKNFTSNSISTTR